MGADHAEPWESDRVSRTAQHPGTEPERVSAFPAPLEVREAQPLPSTIALLGPAEVPQRPVQLGEGFLLHAFGGLPPPRERRRALADTLRQPGQVGGRV